MSQIKSVCVYCGASSRSDEKYKVTARETGTKLARSGRTLVYGGGRVGLMGIVADSALQAGGDVIGIIPEHIQNREVEHHGLTELHIVDSMHERKQMMVDRSDAFFVLPGGLGTMDETFEILTWKQLSLHDKPVVVVNAHGYWDPLAGLIDHIVESGFAYEEDRARLKFAASVDDALALLEKEPDSKIKAQTKWI